MAADLLRSGEIIDAQEVLEVLDAKLPPAEERHPVGAVAARLMLREEILRSLAAGEERGRSALTRQEIDELVAKPEGTSIRCTLDELRREKLITGRYDDTFVSLTREGRARARRTPGADPGEHAVSEPEQLLDLIYRARRGGLTHWRDDGEEERVDQIWHVPIVQGCSGVDAERFAQLAAALELDGLIGPGVGSYRTITSAGEDIGGGRFRAHRLPGQYEPSRLLPPVRRPGEIRRRSEDVVCPNPSCGRPASWLRSRKGKRYDEFRHTGVAEYECTGCDVTWTIYAEPVGRGGAYDPFGDPAVCRPRWAYCGGYWYSDMLAPPDHYQYDWQRR